MGKPLKIIIPIVCSIVLLVVGALIGGIISNRNSNSIQYKYEADGYSADSSYTVTNESSGTIKPTGEMGEMFISSENPNQKLVYTGNVKIGSDDLEKSYNEVLTKVAEFNGKIESLNENTTSKRLTIRVPHDEFMNLFNSFSEISGTITESSMNVEDFTKTYSDNSKYIEILNTEYNELLELMKKAETVDEVLSIRDRLSYLTYDIEKLQSNNSDIDYNVQYSTINLTLNKVGNTIIEDTPFGRRISDSFKDSIEILKDLFLFLINIWWLILIITTIVIFIILKVRKKNRRNLS